MRYILPRLTCLILFTCGPLFAQDAAPRTMTGDQLMAKAVEAFVRQPSLEAKFSQRATLFGKRVAGAGFILQMRDGDRNLLRYEFKMQAGDQSRSILHVSDGTTLWIRRDVDEVKSQAYVNVRRLRQLQAEQPVSSNPTPDFQSALALGGLNELLTNIAMNFEFDEPRPVELKGMQMWEIVGRWKASRLTEFAAGQPGTQTLPLHLPDTVRLFLGQDEKFPLFPYRIMFGRSRPNGANGRGSTQLIIDPMVTIDLYEVARRPDLTTADFAFLPSDENVEDLTDVYAEKLGLTR